MSPGRDGRYPGLLSQEIFDQAPELDTPHVDSRDINDDVVGQLKKDGYNIKL